MEGLPSDSQQPKTDWWHKRHAWIRHSVYWVIALGVIALSAFDGTTAAPPKQSIDAGLIAAFAWFVFAVIGLAFIGLKRTLREQVPPAQTISRSLVTFTWLLATVAGLLFSLAGGGCTSRPAVR